MQQTSSVALSDIMVSVAHSVVEANHILNEGSQAPMGITEFRIRYQLHASLSVPVIAKPKSNQAGLGELARLVRPMELRDWTTLSMRERILTASDLQADLEVTSVIQPLPRISSG